MSSFARCLCACDIVVASVQIPDVDVLALLEQTDSRANGCERDTFSTLACRCSCKHCPCKHCACKYGMLPSEYLAFGLVFSVLH
jgi:hypothetical protein